MAYLLPLVVLAAAAIWRVQAQRRCAATAFCWACACGCVSQVAVVAAAVTGPVALAGCLTAMWAGAAMTAAPAFRLLRDAFGDTGDTAGGRPA